MESQRVRTCQFCFYLWSKNCPFEIIRKEGEPQRNIDEDPCGQFFSVWSGKEFKKRLLLNENEEKAVKTEIKKIRGRKRSLDF